MNNQNKISVLIGMMIHMPRKQPLEIIIAWAHLLFATNLLECVLNCAPALQRAQQPTKLFQLLVTKNIYIFCIL